MFFLSQTTRIHFYQSFPPPPPPSIEFLWNYYLKITTLLHKLQFVFKYRCGLLSWLSCWIIYHIKHASVSFRDVINVIDISNAWDNSKFVMVTTEGTHWTSVADRKTFKCEKWYYACRRFTRKTNVLANNSEQRSNTSKTTVECIFMWELKLR